MLSNNIVKLIKPNRIQLYQIQKSFYCSINNNNNNNNNNNIYTKEELSDKSYDNIKSIANSFNIKPSSKKDVLIKNILNAQSKDFSGIKKNSIKNSINPLYEDYEQLVKKFQENNHKQLYIDNEALFNSTDVEKLPSSYREEVYKSMLYAHSRIPDMDKCEELFPSIDHLESSYEILINGYLRTKMFEKAIEYFNNGMEENLVNKKSLYTLVNTLAFNGKFEMVNQVLEIMESSGVTISLDFALLVYNIVGRLPNDTGDQCKQVISKIHHELKLKTSDFDTTLFSTVLWALFRSQNYSSIINYYSDLFSKPELFKSNVHLISEHSVEPIMASILEIYGSDIGMDKMASFWSLVLNHLNDSKSDGKLYLLAYLKVFNSSIKKELINSNDIQMNEIIENYTKTLNLDDKSKHQTLQHKSIAAKLTEWHLLANDFDSAYNCLQDFENKAEAHGIYYIILEYLARNCNDELNMFKIKMILSTKEFKELDTKGRMLTKILNVLKYKKLYYQLNNVINVIKNLPEYKHLPAYQTMVHNIIYSLNLYERRIWIKS